MKQITTRLYLANTISDEQLNRLSPNIIIVLNSGSTEDKTHQFCLSKGFVSKIHDISKPLDSEIDRYAKMSEFVFATGDKVLVISNDSHTMHSYAAKLLSSATGMLPQDSMDFVRSKIGKTNN